MSELDPVFEAAAEYFRVMSEPTRLRIMHAICEDEKTVSEIVDETGTSQTNASRQLTLMFRAGVLARRKEGALVYYRAADAAMIGICRTVCNQIAGGLLEPDEGSSRRGLLRNMSSCKKGATKPGGVAKQRGR